MFLQTITRTPVGRHKIWENSCFKKLSTLLNATAAWNDANVQISWTAMASNARKIRRAKTMHMNNLAPTPIKIKPGLISRQINNSVRLATTSTALIHGPSSWTILKMTMSSKSNLRIVLILRISQPIRTIKLWRRLVMMFHLEITCFMTARSGAPSNWAFPA